MVMYLPNSNCAYPIYFSYYNFHLTGMLSSFVFEIILVLFICTIIHKDFKKIRSTMDCLLETVPTVDEVDNIVFF